PTFVTLLAGAGVAAAAWLAMAGLSREVAPTAAPPAPAAGPPPAGKAAPDTVEIGRLPIGPSTPEPVREPSVATVASPVAPAAGLAGGRAPSSRTWRSRIPHKTGTWWRGWSTT